MSNTTIKKQTKDLYTHMNDYVNATYQKRKSEAAIFNKHRLPGGEYGSGLKDELSQYRQNFADEWGMNGLRNTQFVKQHFEEARVPTQEEINDMAEQQQEGKPELEAERSKFIAELPHNKPQQKSNQGPKPR